MSMATLRASLPSDTDLASSAPLSGLVKTSVSAIALRYCAPSSA